MQVPPEQKRVYDQELDILYIVHAWRPLEDWEANSVVAQYRASKRQKRGTECTIYTVIGIEDMR